MIGILIFIFQMFKTMAEIGKVTTMASFVISALVCYYLRLRLVPARLDVALLAGMFGLLRHVGLFI